VLRNARRNGAIYHMSTVAGLARNFVLRRASGEWLLRRYDWLYGWQPS
jgi:salicylate hydroxylase